MDIACPNCAATYRVPDSLLARGMALRCAACDHEWVPALAAAAPEPEPTPQPGMVAAQPPEPAPMAPMLSAPAAPPAESATALAEVPRPARPAPPTTPPPLQRRGGPMAVPRSRASSRATRALSIAWAASVAAVALALVSLFVFAEEIALAWPPFARVTSLLSG